MPGEFRGDFTRDTFDPLKHFSRVLMQQGRVQLDTDWNEQASILLHYLQTLAKDLIGDHGGPAKSDGTPGDGFRIRPDSAGNFSIGKGHYYVDGILCQNDVDSLTYIGQAGYPFPSSANLDQNNSYVVFLDVWERHITCLEDTTICEVALGGPDTASRAQVVCQVKVPLFTNDVQMKLQGLVEKLKDATTPNAKKAALQKINELEESERMKFVVRSPILMRARARVGEKAHEPCSISPESQYRGTENQLYRVEIHRTGSAWNDNHEAASLAATFKWSRDNGCVVFPIRTLQGDTVKLAHLGRDDHLGLRENDWVEIMHDTLASQGRPGPLLQVATIDRDDPAITLKPREGVKLFQFEENDPNHPLLRRWDHHKTDDGFSEGAVLLTEDNGEEKDNWIRLEDGVEIQFQPSGQTYRAGDYWLIPARTTTGDVIWPKQKNNAATSIAGSLGPNGIEHRYAPLALITVGPNGTISFVEDLRRAFKQLTNP